VSLNPLMATTPLRVAKVPFMPLEDREAGLENLERLFGTEG
jgi:hypothetical protein